MTNTHKRRQQVATLAGQQDRKAGVFRPETVRPSYQAFYALGYNGGTDPERAAVERAIANGDVQRDWDAQS